MSLGQLLSERLRRQHLVILRNIDTFTANKAYRI